MFKRVMSILLFFIMIYVSEELIPKTTSNVAAEGIFRFSLRFLTRNIPAALSWNLERPQSEAKLANW